MEPEQACCFKVAKTAFTTSDAYGRMLDPQTTSCELGTFAELLSAYADVEVFDYLCLNDDDAFYDALPADSYDVEEREDNAMALEEFIDRLVTVGKVDLYITWSDRLDPMLGAQPKSPGRPPSPPDFDELAAAAVRSAFGALARVAPWKARARRELAIRAREAAQSRFDADANEWREQEAKYEEALRSRKAREQTTVAALGVDATTAQRWFIEELVSMDYALPVYCAATQAETLCRLELVLPSLENHIPLTEVKELKSGRLTVKKASKSSREARWQQACETLSVRVAIAALNSFPACSSVAITAVTADEMDVHLTLEIARDTLAKTGGQALFSALGGRFVVEKARHRKSR